MAKTSQFTVYSDGDFGAPGWLTPTTGSLLTILDACLVNGYGNKAPAGWKKPFPNTSSVGCYQQPSGSLCTLFIQDGVSYTNVSSSEAYAVGWEQLAGLLTSGSTSGSYTSSVNVGSGSGQFPMPVQSLTVGEVIIRKTNDFVVVPCRWLLFADAYTFYFFSRTMDGTNNASSTYCHFAFGDIYSYAGPSDISKCIIIGRYVSGASVSAATGDDTDVMCSISQTGNKGKFISREFGQVGSSVYANTLGNPGFSSAWNIAGQPYAGNMQAPNAPDGSYWISPIWVTNPVHRSVRGRLRGMYHLCHATALFVDGQILSGTNDYAGKTFQVVRGGINGGIWLIEISNTVETN